MDSEFWVCEWVWDLTAEAQRRRAAARGKIFRESKQKCMRRAWRCIFQGEVQAFFASFDHQRINQQVILATTLPPGLVCNEYVCGNQIF